MENKLVVRKGRIEEIEVYVATFQDGEHYIAYCPALDFSAQGANREDAMKNFGEAITEFLDYLMKKGTLAKVLAELNWSRKPRKKLEFIAPDYEKLKSDLPHFGDLVRNNNTLQQEQYAFA